MEVTRKFKEVSIDILLRIAQVIFVAFVITPFITKIFSLSLLVSGGAISAFCAMSALVISLTIKEGE